MKSFVVDTSALLRLFVPDGPLPAEVEQAMEAAGQATAVVLAPELLLVEAGQVLHKKHLAGYLRKEECDEILASILELPIEIVSHREILFDAVQAARRHQITVYDALFLALAVNRSSTLLTADVELRIAWEQCGDEDELVPGDL